MTRTKPNLNATKPSVMRFQMLSETNLPAGLGGSNPPVRTDVCQHADPAVVSESSPAIDLMPAAKSKKAGPLPANVLYHANLRAAVSEEVNDTPKARVHRVEWNKIMNEDPVEINPSIGSGYKVMTVEEWSSRWKRNDDLPACLRCGGTHTKEHHFTQTWCRQKKKWESELLCLDCHAFSWRSYVDPDFLTPEQYQKKYWQQMANTNRIS